MLVVVAVVLVGRQITFSRQRGTFGCALRRRGLTGHRSWQHGLMRFGTDRLRWSRAFSLRVRPDVVIRRADIVDISRRRMPAPGGRSGEESYLVEFSLAGDRRLSAIVDLSSGAALISWMEAAPTGLILGDAD